MSLTEEKLCSSDENVAIHIANESPIIQPTVNTRPSIPAPSLPSNISPGIPPRNYLPLNSQNTYRPYSPYGARPPFYGGYSTHPTYGSPFNTSPYGCNSYFGYGGIGIDNSESRFIRLAEESSRPTFQAIESLVRAVHSISFMMESTYSALNMSFRAVLSVVENLSSFRTFLKNFLASLLAFRVIRKFLIIINAILRTLGILSPSSGSLHRMLEQIDVDNAQIINPNDGLSSQVNSWPFLTFMGLMVAAPYLISKMLPSPEESVQQSVEKSSVPLVAAYDFKAANTNELNLTRGERVHQLNSENTSPYWLLVVNSKNQSGYAPKNHLVPMKKRI